MEEQAKYILLLQLLHVRVGLGPDLFYDRISYNYAFSYLKHIHIINFKSIQYKCCIKVNVVQKK